MTPHDARRRLETVIHFTHGRPVWDARDREAVLAVLGEVEELRALAERALLFIRREAGTPTSGQSWESICAEAARLGCEETKG